MLLLGWAHATLLFFGSQANNPLTSDPADFRQYVVIGSGTSITALAFPCSTVVA
jgi:hypothetical protein